MSIGCPDSSTAQLSILEESELKLEVNNPLFHFLDILLGVLDGKVNLQEILAPLSEWQGVKEVPFICLQ